jgi:hypothetical protein
VAGLESPPGKGLRLRLPGWQQSLTTSGSNHSFMEEKMGRILLGGALKKK